MRIAVPVGAPLDAVWHALTDSDVLERWFCEHADVDLEQGRYDFWGRFTPGTPDRQAGRHEVLKVVDRELLRFAWSDAVVEIALEASSDETTVRLSLEGADRMLLDFWFLALMHGLRGFAEFGVSGAGRLDFTAPSSFVSRAPDGPSFAPGTVVRCAEGEDRVEVSVDIDAPREHVYGVLVADLADRWWVSDKLRERVTYDPPRAASTPFSIDDWSPSLVTWTLEDSDGRTRVTLVHSGFAWQSDDEAIAHALGWFDGLNWLKFLSEVGETAWRPRHSRALEASNSKRAWM